MSGQRGEHISQQDGQLRGFLRGLLSIAPMGQAFTARDLCRVMRSKPNRSRAFAQAATRKTLARNVTRGSALRPVAVEIPIRLDGSLPAKGEAITVSRREWIPSRALRVTVVRANNCVSDVTASGDQAEILTAPDSPAPKTSARMSPAAPATP